ncbi:hypothetical protein T459_31199 [Capsicum annuum]|uniref:tRNA (adenine(58)-N(1))-methyltransferase non-catalytic subunit TRM6 n=1 Tax=Capsicum annuum TaxID=4072 RepID=A0A2G2YAM6_CAPAN|nr:hypothetical protein T459_31199 [Capsicum annuum]
MSINKTVDEDLNQNDKSRLTFEGCNVLLDINDGDRLVFSRLTAASVGTQDGRVVLRRQFQVLVRKGMGLNPILDITSPLCGNTLGNSLEEKDVDGSKDNRAIVDNNTAQSLTSEDIDEM